MGETCPKRNASHLSPRSAEKPTASFVQGLFTLDSVGQMKGLGLSNLSEFKWTDHCAAASKRARNELLKLKSTLPFRKSEEFAPTYKIKVRPHLQAGLLSLLRERHANLEQVQRLTSEWLRAGRKFIRPTTVRFRSLLV